MQDPAHDVWRDQPKVLDAIFKPKNVAVIGATEKKGSVGRILLRNLISQSFGGTVFPVNPKRPSVLGIKAYESVFSVPEKVDLAVVCSPAQTVPGVIGDCAKAGVKGAVIISAGFKELGASGEALEREILSEARRGNMRIIGPNCLGVMNPITGFNATFASRIAHAGNVAFISQSGALCTAILDWSLHEHVGFSAFVSLGSMLDIGWGDLIDYLENDPDTQSILIYMETVGDARSFLSAARQVALSKPIIVLKAGRTAAAAKAAASHTGSLVGSDEVLDAGFRRCGVLRVDQISELFDMVEILAKQPRPKGPKLAILTNAGGPAVLATDTLARGGGEVAGLSPETLETLNTMLPPHWSRGNPVDILGDADPERYEKAFLALAKDASNDGLLVILTPQAMTEPTEIAERLKPYASLKDKPVLASWMGGAEVEAGREILNRAGVPVFPYPDAAARMFHYMWQYSYNLKALYETPTCNVESDAAHRTWVEKEIQAVRKSGRTVLTEFESKKILEAYGIPVVETHVARGEDEAVGLAEKIGYPVVLKLHSFSITHKTEVKGVRLNLQDAAAVRNAYGSIRSSVAEAGAAEAFGGVCVQPMVKEAGFELIIGSSIDAQFGPVILFGSGGQWVEILNDHTLAIPPLTTTLARRAIERTRIAAALKGMRGMKAVDLGLLEETLVRFSRLVVEQPWIREADINPFFVSPTRSAALDARILLHGSSVLPEELPKPAIRPYPTEYVTSWKTKDGLPVTIRPIRPEDEPMLVRFHHTLSEQTIRRRYLRAMELRQRIAHERLVRVCFNDYDREIALVVDRPDTASGSHEILAVGRLSRLADRTSAEFALLVTDAFHNRGIGTQLLRLLVEIARKEKIKQVSAGILSDNSQMQRICGKLGFEIGPDGEKGIVRAVLRLS